MGLRRIYTAVQKVLSGALIEIEAVDMSSGQLRFLLCKAFQLLTLSFSVLGLRVLCGGDKSDLYQGLRRHHRKVSGEASYVWDSGFWVGGGGWVEVWCFEGVGWFRVYTWVQGLFSSKHRSAGFSRRSLLAQPFFENKE